jgi:2-polyprenyl-3-methyl-5-hydroxy-6-metoxy-1,4-benzoquinol methylase
MIESSSRACPFKWRVVGSERSLRFNLTAFAGIFVDSAERSDAVSLEERIAQGGYARKQIHCKSWVVSWSHRTRFETARKMVVPYAGQRLLDYGCGDGTFLAQISDLFPGGTGADSDLSQTQEAAKRLAPVASLKFCTVAELANHPAKSFDVITCMETLEHVSNEDMPGVIANLGRLVASTGRVIISVPIEVGPTLLGKQIVRRIAGWRNLGHYKYGDRYTFGELSTMIFAGEGTEIPRGITGMDLPDGGHIICYTHKGFNWRVLRSKLASVFTIAAPKFSPLNWTGGLASSQVWLSCTPK